MGQNAVILVGHADYYPRFGYTPAGKYNFQAPFELPDDAFMVIELRESGLKEISCMIKFAPEFFPDAQASACSQMERSHWVFAD